MREKFSLIFRLLNSLISWYLDSISTGWPESLKEVSIEFQSVKSCFKPSLEKITVPIENSKLWKPEFKKRKIGIW